MVHFEIESTFHLIFLRNNLLTYYQDELKKTAFKKVIYSLATGGFLIIGAHEKIPLGTPELLPFSRHPLIFQKGRDTAENIRVTNLEL